MCKLSIRFTQSTLLNLNNYAKQKFNHLEPLSGIFLERICYRIVINKLKGDFLILKSRVDILSMPTFVKL